GRSACEASFTKYVDSTSLIRRCCRDGSQCRRSQLPKSRNSDANQLHGRGICHCVRKLAVFASKSSAFGQSVNRSIGQSVNRFISSASSIISTPSDRAFSSLLPASA